MPSELLPIRIHDVENTTSRTSSSGAVRSSSRNGGGAIMNGDDVLLNMLYKLQDSTSAANSATHEDAYERSLNLALDNLS